MVVISGLVFILTMDLVIVNNNLIEHEAKTDSTYLLYTYIIMME
jgi:hypothetical protein